MTEQLPENLQPYSGVLTYNTPAELPVPSPQHTLAEPLEPLELFARDGGIWVPVAAVGLPPSGPEREWEQARAFGLGGEG